MLAAQRQGPKSSGKPSSGGFPPITQKYGQRLITIGMFGDKYFFRFYLIVSSIYKGLYYFSFLFSSFAMYLADLSSPTRD